MPSPRPALLRRTVPILALLLLAAALPALITAPPAAAADAPSSDLSARAIADQVMTALGGKQAWDDTHYLRFTFVGRRTHYWDKWTGRHRVEGTNREGAPYVVLENVNTKQGKAYVSGQEVTGEQAAKLLELAYGTWINDTYWLLMPYKLQDPGVHLASGGEDTVDGKKYDKLELSFDHVGLTPGDHYTVWVNHDTHLVDRWAYLLESAKPEEKPTGWTWEGWTTYGKIKLAPHRGMIGGDRSLDLTDIAVFDTLPDAVFDSPAPVAK